MALRWSKGGGLFLVSEVALYTGVTREVDVSRGDSIDGHEPKPVNNPFLNNPEVDNP